LATTGTRERQAGCLVGGSRVPSGHVKVVRLFNDSRDRPGESRPDVSPNYMSICEERNLRPSSGKPFVWCEVVAPPRPRGTCFALLFYSRFCPSYMNGASGTALLLPVLCPTGHEAIGGRCISSLAAHWWARCGSDGVRCVDDTRRQGGHGQEPFTQDVPQKELRQLLGIRWSYSPPAAATGWSRSSELAA